MAIKPSSIAGFRAKAAALRDFIDETGYLEEPEAGEFARGLAVDLVAFDDWEPEDAHQLAQAPVA